MKFWVALSSSVAALLLAGSALADPSPADALSGGKITAPRPIVETVAQLAAVTDAMAQLAANTAVVPSPAVTPAPETLPAAPAVAPPPVVAAPVTSRPKALAAAAPSHAATAASTKASEKAAKRAAGASRRERVAAAEAKPVAVRAVGRAETGRAAWYGGHYVGQRTSNGERLDNIHATAAHRTLPLNCLARVTNLRNGRSVVVRVTDRGPIGDDLLIDMSPRAADELRMKDDGVVPVRVEQVEQVAVNDK